jgi:hypothetical protein
MAQIAPIGNKSEKSVVSNNDSIPEGKKTDSIKNLTPKVTNVQTVTLTNLQSSDIADIKKDITPDSAKKLCIAYPNNVLHFTITNPLTFLKSRPKDQARVVIYVNGMELKGISTAWENAVTGLMIETGKVPAFGKTANIYIQLKRNDTTHEAWNFLYNNKPGFWDNFANTDASIGWEGMSALEKTVNAPRVKVIFYYKKVLYPWTALFVIILAGFIILAFYTNTMREGNKSSAYSLSLTQLMFWTTLVIAAFIYTLVLTDIPSTFNSSILIMLGISISTTGAATVIDSRFKQNNLNIRKRTNGFFKDLLTSDGESYSVQRIQTFAWNLVLGLYFITYTIANKSMPVFSSTLLFLAGISSASYVGTKVPENNDLKTQAAVASQANNMQTTTTATNLSSSPPGTTS